MNKFEYLVRNLSSTKRKNYENYVINKVYFEINDLDIKPVSQQYVRRSENTYAMIDLYFPQFNIGVECDELHHKKQFESDQLRFFDIANSIDSYEEIRIRIYKENKDEIKDIEEINNEIKKAAKKIKSRKKSCDNFIPWDNRRDIEKALENKEINVSDNYIFNQEEIRRFFNRTGKTQHCYYRIMDGYHIWMPGLTIKNGDRYIKYNENKDFINILENDGKTIYEYFQNMELDGEKEKTKRIVFLKMKDPILNTQVYKFIGIFYKSNKIKEMSINEKKLKFRVYEKLSDTIKKPKNK